MVFIGTQKIDEPYINYREYDETDMSLEKDIAFNDLPANRKHKVQWYNVVGLHDSTFMREVAERLNVHPLAMEDVMNTGQRAKFEEFNEHLFITLKMLQFDQEKLLVTTEQVSFIFNRDYLITFQEEPGDTFDPIRRRLENPNGMIRKNGPGFLAYALIDSIVDNYIYLIESIGEKVDDLELKVLENKEKDLLQQINAYKRELHFIMKVTKPVRDLVLQLQRSQTDLMDMETARPYITDLEGLITHAIESAETYRTLLTDYLNLYHSSMSTKMNDIMKVLTIFSAIFIPLSFFAGVYGTNFQHFPELEYRYSYPIFWGFMLLIALTMLWFFKRKDWF